MFEILIFRDQCHTTKLAENCRRSASVVVRGAGLADIEALATVTIKQGKDGKIKVDVKQQNPNPSEQGEV